MGFFSQRLKRRDQIVLRFLNIYKTKVISHAGDCTSFEDLQYFQVMLCANGFKPEAGAHSSDRPFLLWEKSLSHRFAE